MNRKRRRELLVAAAILVGLVVIMGLISMVA